MHRRTTKLAPVWPIYALLYGYPVWWFLGLQAFIWVILAVPMGVSLLRRGTFTAPRGVGVFLLFLLWMLASASQLADSKQVLAFLYRGSLYISALILLLYVWSLSREQLPIHRLVTALAFLWGVTVLGGWAGLILPDIRFTSITALMLPESLASNSFVQSLVQPGLASTTRLLGYEIARPKAPFHYTNEWGSNLGLLVPFAIYLLQLTRHRLLQLLILGLLAISIVPIIVSINRGLWLSLIVAGLYVAVRLAGRGKAKALMGLLAGSALLAMVVLLSPLSNVIADRFARPNLQGREVLYSQAVESVISSPLLGHGAPFRSDDPAFAGQPSVGTHGQLWTVLVSQGAVGLLLFAGFFAVTFLLTAKVSSPGLWPHAVLLVALLQMAFYSMVPVQIHIVMLAVALCWKDLRFRRFDTEAQVGSRLATTTVAPAGAAV